MTHSSLNSAPTKDGKGDSYVIIKAPEGQRFAPTQISLVSAHDEPEGDPYSWFVYACVLLLLLLLSISSSSSSSADLSLCQTPDRTPNAPTLCPHCRKLYGHAGDDQWDLLLSVEAHKFGERLETAAFPIPPKQNGQYSQFKFLITQIRDADKADYVHLAELRLEGMPAPSPPETGVDQARTVPICPIPTAEMVFLNNLNLDPPPFLFSIPVQSASITMVYASVRVARCSWKT
jgi:hypothetical protein